MLTPLIVLASMTWAQGAQTPLIVATSFDPTDIDRRLPDEDAESAQLPPNATRPDLLKKALAKGYVLKQFEQFRLIYPPNIFNLLDTARQMDVLKQVRDLLAHGRNGVRLSDLTRGAQDTVRGMFPAAIDGQSIESQGDNKDFTLVGSSYSGVTLRSGSHSVRVWAAGDSPPMSQLKNLSTERSDPKDRVQITPDMLAQRDTQELHLVFPENRPSWVLRLAWNSQITKFFTDECTSARNSYNDLTQQLLSKLPEMQVGRYGDLLAHGEAKLADLNDRDSSQLLNNLRASRAPGVGNLDAFWHSASVDGISTTFTLGAIYIDRIDAHSATSTWQGVFFRCPVGP